MEMLAALWSVDPWLQAGWMCVALTLGAWLLSVVTREYSWVDRLWSVAPPLYAIWVAASAGFADIRLTLMAALVTAWGVRLTFNFARKGGYWVGGEDYRWAILQERMGPVRFQLFNATFIAPFQMGLVWLFTCPLHVAWQARGAPLSALDVAAALLFVALLGVEAVADEQMWSFQLRKRAALTRGEPVEPGFLTGGLYRWSRHPNYFGEIGQWWAFALFAVAAGGTALTWAWAGAALLTLLFVGSIRFTEQISAGRYREYAAYQRSTSPLIPWPPRR
jgi:steroid 5-alpha reductase family enzyme